MKRRSLLKGLLGAAASVPLAKIATENAVVAAQTPKMGMQAVSLDSSAVEANVLPLPSHTHPLPSLPIPGRPYYEVGGATLEPAWRILNDPTYPHYNDGSLVDFFPEYDPRYVIRRVRRWRTPGDGSSSWYNYSVVDRETGHEVAMMRDYAISPLSVDIAAQEQAARSFYVTHVAQLKKPFKLYADETMASPSPWYTMKIE